MVQIGHGVCITVKVPLVFCLAAIVAVPSALSEEVPVRSGLIARVEVAAQAEARSKGALPALVNGQPVDFVLDGVDKNRRWAQSIADHRPRFLSDGNAACLKFDGKNDFLEISDLHHPLSELTVILLAAPKANRGNFSGLFAASALGKNDYTSGLNFDFGRDSTEAISVLNVESAGATGFSNLLTPGFFNATERPFGGFHVFTVRTKAGKAGTEIFLDGFKGGDRARAESMIALDQVILGGRFYSNDPNEPPCAQGMFEGALAEVVIYDRALSDDERRAVEQSFLARTVALQALLNGAKGHSLETVPDVPPVQMMVPGFTVRELPLKIGNINNVRYRHDGKLVALGYDGRIHLLTDSDGDGLEDRDELFWDQKTLRGPIGMALTGKNDPRGDGVFVASKGKLSFILDKTRSGRAQQEIVAATGWGESFHNVDTLGVAIDPRSGSIYFGVACANFADPYLMEKSTGQARYRQDDIHGTIQKLSPDFSKKETICTGVRFTCALAFNQAGDLFATDQEGATWLPNGNPLDELLHIEPGKHYGFPPRHPKHLPAVRDEPAIMEYAPQHQSTVGMVFNEGVNGGPSFGPAHWRGDALICGESRGKLWRTKLAQTALGYVGETHQIASLSMLTVDACVSPQGDLVVACHSGPPDWGTGPGGTGRIFKISYTRPELPQPVRAWAAGPDEFKIAFDRPLTPADWAGAKSNVVVEAGEYVGAGDRFEVIRPGYQVVRDQLATPRRWIDVLGLTLNQDWRTLALRIARQTEAINYAVTLPLPGAWRSTGGLPQHSQIDLKVTLNGVAAAGITASGKEIQTVLPHPSLAASAFLTRGSMEHENFLKDATKVTLHSLVNLANPFVPAVQPGARLDWDMAKDPFASLLFRVAENFREAALDFEPVPNTTFARWKTTVFSPEKPPEFFLQHDKLRHRISTARIILPFATGLNSPSKAPISRGERTHVTGNWLRGRRLFFGEAGCATCHTIRGEGVAFGPDLTNLIFRDRESVLRDILEPSASINPDQAGTLIELKDGTSVAGLIRSQTPRKITISLPAGAQIEIDQTAVSRFEPLKTSLMPEGFREKLSTAQLEDLLTYLLINPIEPAPVTRTDPSAPKARSIAELKSALAATRPVRGEGGGHFRILLCAGPKDHGPDEHDYPLWLERWGQLLELDETIVVTKATGFPTGQQLAQADVAVFYNANSGWSHESAASLDAFQRKGGGTLYLHYAVNGGNDPDSVAERMGMAFTAGSRFRHGEFDLVFGKVDHPITRGFPVLHLTDETYWKMKGAVERLNVLGSAVEENELRPLLWTLDRAKGRVVGCIPGHYTWTFDDPLYRLLVLRAICWAGRQENVDRLSDLALVGARFDSETN